MKKLLFSIVLAAVLCATGTPNGVIVSKTSGFLPLINSEIQVTIEGQVAITTTTQVFRNTFGDSLIIQYGFPLPLEASALGIKYLVNSQWYEAEFAAKEQDTISTGGGEVNYELNQYLGSNPLVYSIEQELLPDSTITVKLTYVELLPYKFGLVNYYYPNNYTSIQTDIINLQTFTLTLLSERTIEDIQLLSHTATSTTISDTSAEISFEVYEVAASNDYHVQYALNLEELGLYTYSTYVPDTVVPDEHGRGYFMFIAEPDPSESSEVIDKVFTLIVDRSGSMSGDKIVQARNAAKFIVENLNAGDKFNIVDFADDIKSFRGEHVEYNGTNETAALNYIETLIATGSTNISGAFGTAVPQFSAASSNTANIIIFFTDGEQTSGITNTDDLIEYIDNLVVQSETNVIIFTFGIGSYTNTRLLNTIAANNSGIAEFLGNDELESRITEFYLMIRNPVLLNTDFETDPAGFLKETYPVELPNLYKGQQMILTGRYQEKAAMDIVFNGEAFGELVSYNYSPELSDSNIQKLIFIPKVWAKQKIEYLLSLYYQLDPSSEDALDLKEQVIDLSLDYRVISPFTSFQGGQEVDEEDRDSYNPGGAVATNMIEFEVEPATENILVANLGNYPNPFSSETVFRFDILSEINELAVLRIYNSAGMLIREFSIMVNGEDTYEIRWVPGEMDLEIVPGVYTYSLSIGKEVAVGRLIYKGR